MRRRATGRKALGAELRAADEARLAAEQKLEPARAKIEEMRLKEQAAALRGAAVRRPARGSARRRRRRCPTQLKAFGNKSRLAGRDRAAAERDRRARRGQPRRARRARRSRPSARSISTRRPPTSPRRWPRSRTRSARSTANRGSCCSRPSTRSTRTSRSCSRCCSAAGRRSCVLTGEEILDSGVQVVAQPPGKRNTSIHLLSGGEKALTAISLVFALFQLNPAPFCLLDEVDAPLDDPNTDRFCRMVSDMARRDAVPVHLAQQDHDGDGEPAGRHHDAGAGRLARRRRRHRRGAGARRRTRREPRRRGACRTPRVGADARRLRRVARERRRSTARYNRREARSATAPRMDERRADRPDIPRMTSLQLGPHRRRRRARLRRHRLQLAAGAARPAPDRRERSRQADGAGAPGIRRSGHAASSAHRADAAGSATMRGGIPENPPRGAAGDAQDDDGYEPPLAIQARIASDMGADEHATPRLAAGERAWDRRRHARGDRRAQCAAARSRHRVHRHAAARPAGDRRRARRGPARAARQAAALVRAARRRRAVAAAQVGHGRRVFRSCRVPAARRTARARRARPLLDAFRARRRRNRGGVAGGVSSRRTRGAEAARAEALDRLCADLDVQIGLTLLKTGAATIPGTRLRGIAEAAGFRLVGGGRFDWVQEETGAVLYSLQNYRSEPFTADTLRADVDARRGVPARRAARRRPGRASSTR